MARTGTRVQVVSSVGSGDAFLGGLAIALDDGKDLPDALCDAVAAGTANALSAGGGQFALEEFEQIRKQVQIQASLISESQNWKSLPENRVAGAKGPATCFRVLFITFGCTEIIKRMATMQSKISS